MNKGAYDLETWCLKVSYVLGKVQSILWYPLESWIMLNHKRKITNNSQIISSCYFHGLLLKWVLCRLYKLCVLDVRRSRALGNCVCSRTARPIKTLTTYIGRDLVLEFDLLQPRDYCRSLFEHSRFVGMESNHKFFEIFCNSFRELWCMVNSYFFVAEIQTMQSKISSVVLRRLRACGSYWSRFGETVVFENYSLETGMVLKGTTRT